MKITKRQLKRIIQEESVRLFLEDSRSNKLSLFNENKLRKAIRSQLIVESNASQLQDFVGEEGRQEALQIINNSPDAFALYGAMAGLGTDEETVYAILQKREDSIPALYQEYGALMDKMRSEARGFEDNLTKYGITFLLTAPLFVIGLAMNLVSKAARAGAKSGAKKGREIGRAFDDSTAGKVAPFFVVSPLAGFINLFRVKRNKKEAIKTAGQNAGAGALAAAEGEPPPEGKKPDMLPGFGETFLSAFGAGAEGSKEAMDATMKSAGYGLLGAGAVTAIMAIIDNMGVDSFSDDLVAWLRDDGMDDAADFVQERL